MSEIYSKKRVSSNWDTVIKPKTGWFKIDIVEIIKYRDLIFLFVKRDFVTFYKQTILGPFWYIIQPIVNSLVFTLIFGKIAKIPTDGLPPFLFYLSGTVVWGYFSHCLNEISRTFLNNAEVFGKVYFPRITVPISVVITAVVQFTIQVCIFLGFLVYFKLNNPEIKITVYALALPLIVIHMAMLSIGVGMLISAMTAKYRDLSFAMGFMVQLWMYVTPIVYPLSEVPDRYKLLILINPMTAVVECFRGAFLGVISLTEGELLSSIIITLVIFFLGIVCFNRVEKSFIDTV